MNYADYKKYDVLNGEGLRQSLFVSGCTHYCPNCFNKDAWDFNYGKPFTKDLEDNIIKDLNDEDIQLQGLSLLGGEPFDNTSGLIPFIKRVKSECVGKDVWVWSGYTFEQIIKNPVKHELLLYCDVLVDGKYMEELRNLKLRFRGSENQRVISIQESIKQGEVVRYCE